MVGATQRAPEGVRAVLIGIDQGTTGTTCLALSRELTVIGQAYRALPNYYPRAGWVEQDPEEVLDTVVESVGEVLNKVKGERVEAVGLANQGETVVAWDRATGGALTPAIVWSDKRSTGIVSALGANGKAERILELTGLRLDSYFSASKIRWLLDNDEAVRSARASGNLLLGTLDTWIAWKLGGRRYLSDHSTASRTQLMAQGEDDWCDELLDLFDVPREALPNISPSLGDWGELEHPSWGRALPWRASLVDQPAALAGNACFLEGETKVTYGTGCFALFNAGNEPASPPVGLLPITAWSEGRERVYAVEGGVFTAGTAINWLVQVGLVPTAQETDTLAQSVDATAEGNGVRFLPALTGLGSPWWETNVSGAFAGLTAGTTRAQLVRAVLDSIAFRVNDILRAAWNGGLPRPSCLRVDGGMTGNRYLMQRQADLLGIPVVLSPTREATALGAAALAGIAAGILRWEDVREAVAATETVPPHSKENSAEAEYTAWRDWVELTCEQAIHPARDEER